MCFPFAILKISSSFDGPWPVIERIGFKSVRRLLRLQEALLNAADHTRPKQGGLVWFLACIGPVWRIYGCWKEAEKDKLVSLLRTIRS
jgi:hypothetical protein